MMKIKNIDDFTLEECQQFIAQNPSSPDLTAVVNRMNNLLMRKTEDLQYEDFLLKYNRLKTAQNYHDAFCLALSMLSSSINSKMNIYKIAIDLLETNLREIWRYSSVWNYYELRVTFKQKYNVDWLIDRATEAQFIKVKKIHNQLFIGGYPGMFWHSYYFKKSLNNFYLRYRKTVMTPKQDVEKMLKTIGLQLAEDALLSSNKY